MLEKTEESRVSNVTLPNMGSDTESTLPLGIRVFIVVFFVYELLFILGAFSTRYFFMLSESHRAISLGLLIIMTLLMKRARNKDRGKVPWYDYLLMTIGAIGCFYIAPTSKIVELQMASPVVKPFELALGIATLLVLLEGTRRISGWILPLILVFFIFYAVFANHFPWVFYGRAHSFTRVIGEIYLSLDGIFGNVMGLWTRILVVFILFGGFLKCSGAGQFFIDFALSITGHMRGGPAKVAIIASGLFGTISGSAAADVATTGVVTIPMMKGAGYRPAFAGAVEAVASTGGVLMPPMMGMVAFLVAEFLDIPYLQVCIAAAVPALLYYLSLYMLVDFEAKRTGLMGMPRTAIPSFKKTMKEGWFYFVPILVLVFFLAILRYPPGMSALYSLLSLFVVTAFKKETRFTWKKVMAGFEAAAQTSLVMALICGSVGILISSVVITGVTLRLAMLLVQISGGHLLVLLLFSGITSLLLGTGVPAIASYVLLAVTVAPAMVKLGVPEIGAHLFVLYWGISHVITPPVGGTLYIASSFSGVDIWRQGYYTMKLGIAVFVVPFIFCYHPELLMIGSAGPIVIRSFLALAAMFCVTSSFIGYLFKPLNKLQRLIMLLAGIALIIQTPVIGFLGGAMMVATILWQRMQKESVIEAKQI
ncbi:MAG: TRAP transporter fused permease subunit [Deltaproteobacteria bacterium]|nr:TRAP transporter fused permease subunit [Deltaproteobacteria bacterium]